MKYSIVVLFVCSILVGVVAYSQVPNKISYQGLLTTSSGIPVASGSYDLRFDIYNASTGGTLRYSDTRGGVSVQRGTFSVILDSLPGIFTESLYVEVTALAGPGISSPITFSPRSELTSAPYAFRADTARYALSAPGQWTISGSDIYYNNGNVGIGTASPQAKLEVRGRILPRMEYIPGSPSPIQAYTHTTDPSLFTDPTNPGEEASVFSMTGIEPRIGEMPIDNTWAGYDIAGVASTSGFIAARIAAQFPYLSSDNSETNLLFLTGGIDGFKERLRIDTRGNIGIGTTTPSEKLEVAGNIKVGNATIRSGTGSPENIVTGNIGDLYLRTDGGSGTTLYVKESGNGTNTGWIGK